MERIYYFLRCLSWTKKKMSLKDFLDENYFHLENAVCRKCRRKISSYYCYDCKDFICENCQYNQHDSRHKITDYLYIPESFSLKK